MSKFLRRMESFSRKPSDFKPIQESTPGIESSPAIEPTPGNERAPGIAASPAITDTPAVESTPGIRAIPAIQTIPGIGSTPAIEHLPGFNSRHRIGSAANVQSSPAVVSYPGIETSPGIKVPKPRLARLAQDGHSLGEQAVYQALWENATAAADGNRIIKVGFGSLTRLARLAERNCRLNVRSLIEKLAVEEIQAENCSAMEGKTYRVYSYSAILERRRAAGMLWVIRTKGVRFVPTPGVESLPGITSAPGLASTSPVASAPGAQTSPDPGVESSLGPGVDSTPLYRNSSRKEIQEEESSSSQNTSVIVERLSWLGVKIDDDAATRIIHRCQNANSTATVEEIAHFAALKVRQLAKRRNIDNWAGMLISSVPAYFDAPATELQRYRADIENQKGRELEAARKIIDDPESSEDDRQWARGIVGE